MTFATIVLNNASATNNPDWHGAVHGSVRRGEDDKLCLLGSARTPPRQLLAVEDGYRESTDSWTAAIRGPKHRDATEPERVVGDGSRWTWAALRDVYPTARRQACWLHATCTALDCLPKRLQPHAKGMLHEIMEARPVPRRDIRAGGLRCGTSSTPSTRKRSPSSTVTGST